MERKYQAGIVALILIGALAAGAFALGAKDHQPRGGFRGPGMSAAAMTAIQNDDYAAFTASLAADNSSVTITQDQFEKMAARAKGMAARRDAMRNAQDAVKAGDYASWRDAMGVLAPDQNSTLTQDEFDAIVQRERAGEKVQQAIESNDFQAWTAAMSEQFSAQLTRERFDMIVKHHQEMQDNNTSDTARGPGMPGEDFGAPLGPPAWHGMGAR